MTKFKYWLIYLLCCFVYDSIACNLEISGGENFFLYSLWLALNIFSGGVIAMVLVNFGRWSFLTKMIDQQTCMNSSSNQAERLLRIPHHQQGLREGRPLLSFILFSIWEAWVLSLLNRYCSLPCRQLGLMPPWPLLVRNVAYVLPGGLFSWSMPWHKSMPRKLYSSWKYRWYKYVSRSTRTKTWKV